MITVEVKGDYKKTTAWLKKLQNGSIPLALEAFGEQGVVALASATPVDSGLTASSWRYTVKRSKRGFEIVWHNDHINDGANIAILLQYGHGQHNGGYVRGRDYINPGIRPVFENIAREAWKAVMQG